MNQEKENKDERKNDQCSSVTYFLYKYGLRDFRIMYNVKSLLLKNKREYEIMNDIGLMDWQLEKYLKKTFPYKLKELESILLKLANLDLEIKSGKIDRFTGLELFILDICE